MHCRHITIDFLLSVLGIVFESINTTFHLTLQLRRMIMTITMQHQVIAIGCIMHLSRNGEKSPLGKYGPH